MNQPIQIEQFREAMLNFGYQRTITGAPQVCFRCRIIVSKAEQLKRQIMHFVTLPVKIWSAGRIFRSNDPTAGSTRILEGGL